MNWAGRERVWFAAPGPENWTREGGTERGEDSEFIDVKTAKRSQNVPSMKSSKGGANPQSRVCCLSEELGNLDASLWN
jgi:hypothetical protein